MRLRAYKYYFLYIFSIKTFETVIVVVDVGIVITSLLILRKELSFEHADGRAWPIALLAGLAIAKFLFEAYKMYDGLNDYFEFKDAVEKEKAVSYDEILMSEKEMKLGYKKMIIQTGKPECVFFSERINDYLQHANPTVTVETRPAIEVKKTIEENFDVLLLFLNYYFFNSLRNRRALHNGKKLCLSRDLEIGAPTVFLHAGRYFDSLLTNELFAKYLERADDGMVIADAQEFDPIDYELDGSMRLRDLTTSQMNNHFGGSTLAMTGDQYLVIWRQNFTTQVSRDLLAPTGSGSSNAGDLTSDFKKTVIRTMERELLEECSLDEKVMDTKIHTRLLGFYRWVNRGGLPQFVGISKVNLPLSDFEPNKKEVMKNHANVRENMEYVHDIDDLPRAIAVIRQKGVLSVPLHMNLLFLEAYYEKRKKDLAAFWFF